MTLSGTLLVGALIWNLCILTSSSFVWFNKFGTMMDRIQDHKHANDGLLLGDFNTEMFKSISTWASTFSLFKLHQCVLSATRVTLTTSTLIDHIYVKVS